MRFWATVLLSFLAVASATGQSRLSLEECIELAKENNSSLAAVKSSVEAALYDFKSVRGNFYPQFSLSGMGLYSTSKGSIAIPGGNLPVMGATGAPTGSFAYFPGIELDYNVDWLFGAAVSLRQPLYMGGKVRSGYRMAKYASEIAGQSIRVEEAEIVVKTSRAYMDLVKANELKKVAEKYNALVTNLLKEVQSGYKNGILSKNDLLKVEVRLNESLLAVRRAENGIRLASMNLCHLTGRRLGERIEVSEEIPPFPEEIAADADISARPEFMMLEKKSEIARQQVKMARSESLPQLALLGSYGYMHGFKLNDKNFFGDWGFTAGIGLSIPIFHFGTKANKVKAARARYEQTLSQERESNELMELEITLAANNLDEALLERELAEISLRTATESLRMSESQYRAGAERLSDLLEAQLMWQQAEQRQIEARINGYVRWVEYLKATGRTN